MVWSVGDVESPILPRSCNKPIQALGMVRAGLDLPPDLLALACASHSGEPFHIEGVRRILASAGLSEADLQTPPDYPLDDAAREQVIREGGSKAAVLMNCSGKHAAMLATCASNGWPTETYLDPDHPVQQAIAATFAEMTGEPVAVTAVDGCGAPLLSASLVGLARAFGRVALGVDGSGAEHAPSARIADAIRSHPAYVSGTTRDERALLTAIPGAIGKAGAECCYAVALADGRAFALKADDGAPRVRPVLMAEALRRTAACSRTPPSTPTPYAGPGSSSCSAAGSGSVRSGPSSRDRRSGARRAGPHRSLHPRPWPTRGLPADRGLGPLAPRRQEPMEGATLVRVTQDHGLTAADLAGLVGIGLGLRQAWPDLVRRSRRLLAAVRR